MAGERSRGFRLSSPKSASLFVSKKQMVVGMMGGSLEPPIQRKQTCKLEVCTIHGNGTVDSLIYHKERSRSSQEHKYEALARGTPGDATPIQDLG